MSAEPSVDVLVVGGGPIGLAAAIEARLAGLTVGVLEPRPAPIDKACGEGLMPGAVAALQRLGVRPVGWELSGISYQRAGPGTKYRADHRFTNGNGLGVRRTVLHAALTARAAELGVEPVAIKLDSLVQDREGVRAGGLLARWLLGCDGLHSRVSALAGLDAPARGMRRFGLRRHFAVAPWSSFVEVRWLPDAEVYITPVAADLVGVAVLGPAHTDYARAVAAVPELSGRLPAGPLRGAGPFRRRTARRVAGRVLLVGDASGYVDAITGEGIRVGLAQARAAIACIVAGDPGRYERDWRRASGDFRKLTGGVLVLAGSPLRPAIVPLAQRLPGLYGTVVERLAR
ncbi:NAD(P)/FAD-dependent oxidoreductase [Parafrigoribacterium mesophilum]|uniref:NAD(P)/FAD-dependent oxidoreductase n=1 Tax=Parafrigoribacterium mesophilum TaxID=433646 RepID=UPI0031FD61F8